MALHKAMNFRDFIRLDEQRSPADVFEDHLKLRQGSHNIEEDLKRNYSDKIVLLTNFGTFNGKDGVRKCAGILKKQLPCAEYTYKKKAVKDNVAFLEWSGECGKTKVEDGSDTFVIENGLIITQTIHYTVRN